MRLAFLYRIFFFAILFFFVNGFVLAQKLDEVKLNESFQDQPLKEFLDILHNKYGLKVYYKETWIEPFTITKKFENTPLLQALNSIFNGHELTFMVFQDNTIAVFRRTMDIRPHFDEQAQQLIVGDPMNIGRYKTAWLRGKVIDGKSGDPLPGAVVFQRKLEKGATTNSKGEFEIMLPTGNNDLQISFMGFESTNASIRLIEDGTVEFQLFEESHNIGEITVLGAENDLPRAQMSMVKMTSTEMKQLPALMGEVDVLKGLTMLAGVQTVSELSSGFNVRGGNTDQNLILINGSPVFNSSHMFGFLSLINPDVVEDVRLFKGGIPVKMGERVASVMEVDFKDGNNEAIRMYGGIGIINSRLTLEGPLSKNKKLTFIAGGRSSYTNWMLKQIPDLSFTHSKTNFYDATTKLTYKFNPHNKVSIMGYVSNDEFNTSSQSVTRYGSVMGNFSLNTRITELLYGDLELSHSEYNFQLTDYADQKPEESYYLSNLLKYSSAGYYLKWHVTPRHNAEAGFKLVYNQISPGEITPLEDITVIEHRKLENEKMVEGAVYLGDEFEILPKFTIAGGIRYTYAANIGTPIVYIYNPDKPMTPENVIDSLHFGPNEITASYGGLAPRLLLSYDLQPNTTLKLSYQRVRQNIFQLSNSAVISPAETWKTIDYHLKPIISDQVAVGIEKNAWKKEIDLSVEIYYKNLQNLIEYKNGEQLIMNSNIETALIPTKGYSYGIEISAKKNVGRLTGYASYVFSSTMQKNTSKFEDENFWDGKYYRSIYDRPHDFSMTTTYNISRRWRFSANFVFISGRPVTLPEIKYVIADEQLIHYSERNKYRMPSYHRADLSITWDENLRKKRMWKGSWTFAIYNVYGRKNPYSVYYRKSTPGEGNDFRKYSLYKLSVIGVPVPSLTYNFKF